MNLVFIFVYSSKCKNWVEYIKTGIDRRGK